MSRKRPEGVAKLVAIFGKNPARGEVYWFLWQGYDDIQERTEGRPIFWVPVLKEIQSLGLKNAHGRPVAKEDSVRKTWMRVCADKKREAEAKQQRAAERRRPTSDPPPVVARTVTPVLRPQPVVPETGTRTAKEQNEWLLAETMQRSGKRGR